MVYKSLNMSCLGCEIKYFIPHAKINKKSVTFAQKCFEKIETNR